MEFVECTVLKELYKDSDSSRYTVSFQKLGQNSSDFHLKEYSVEVKFQRLTLRLNCFEKVGSSAELLLVFAPSSPFQARLKLNIFANVLYSNIIPMKTSMISGSNCIPRCSISCVLASLSERAVL